MDIWRRSWSHGQCQSVWKPIRSICTSKSRWNGVCEHPKQHTRMHFCCETFLFYCYSLFIYSFYSGRMRDHSSSPWLTALCCRSFGLSLAFLAVGSFSLEPHRSAAKLCSFSWAWISSCTRRMAWVRVQDHSLCQVPKLTNYQGKNKRAVTTHVKKYQS